MPHEPDGPVTPPAHGRETPPGEAFDTDLAPEEEPTTTGTLFIMVLFLMALVGMWGIMYFTLLNR
jgi:hypothetical protein